MEFWVWKTDDVLILIFDEGRLLKQISFCQTQYSNIPLFQLWAKRTEFGEGQNLFKKENFENPGKERWVFTMPNELVINARPHETRVALIENGIVV